MTATNINLDDMNCFVCDNYIFKGLITVDTTTKKIKLCSKICFEKYCIMTHQIRIKTRPQDEKKKGS